MVNLEPNWEALGHLVVRVIEDSNIPGDQKDGLTKMVEQMASIAHHTRANQLLIQLSRGEIGSVPKWVEETRHPEWKEKDFCDWLVANGHGDLVGTSSPYLQELRLEYEMQDDPDYESHRKGVEYYKSRFIGGPLDGTEKQMACHEGINDGFWTYTHTTATAIYDYKRVARGHFEDSDYVLIRSVPKSAEELKANQQSH